MVLRTGMAAGAALALSACANTATYHYPPAPYQPPMQGVRVQTPQANTDYKPGTEPLVVRPVAENPDPLCVEAVNAYYRGAQTALVADAPVQRYGSWIGCPISYTRMPSNTEFLAAVEVEGALQVFDLVSSGSLEEYVRAHGMPQSPRPIDMPIRTWRIDEEQDPITGTQNLHFVKNSLEPVYRDFGRRHQPALVIACWQNRTQVYVDIPETYLGRDEVLVQVRLDDEPAETVRWRYATSGNALGYFSGSTAIPLARRLSAAHELTIRFTPFSENTWTIQFDLEESAQAVARVRGACNW